MCTSWLQTCWEVKSKASGMWHCVVGQVVSIVLKDHNVFILRVTESSLYASTVSLWRWWYCGPSKLWEVLFEWHSLTSQKTWIFSYTSGNLKSCVLENMLFQFIFLLRHKFYLHLTSFYLENKLFHTHICQHVRLSDTHTGMCLHIEIYHSVVYTVVVYGLLLPASPPMWSQISYT
jgi:hypothetical protein